MLLPTGKSPKSMDGSEPSGAGPIAGALGSGLGGGGKLNGMWTERWSSICSPLILPSKVLIPYLKET